MALNLNNKKFSVRGDSRAVPVGTAYYNGWPYLVPNECFGVYDNDSTSGISTAGFANSRIPIFDDTTYAFLVMALGTNDVRANRSAALYKADYRAKLDAAIAKGWPPSQIIIPTIGYFTDYISGSLSLLLACNVALQELALEYNTPFIDTYTYFSNLSNKQDYYVYEGGTLTHENTLGNRELATLYENASYTVSQPLIVKNKKVLV